MIEYCCVWWNFSSLKVFFWFKSFNFHFKFAHFHLFVSYNTLSYSNKYENCEFLLFLFVEHFNSWIGGYHALRIYVNFFFWKKSKKLRKNFKTKGFVFFHKMSMGNGKQKCRPSSFWMNPLNKKNFCFSRKIPDNSI